MEKVTIILNEGPTSMRTWNGMRIAAGLIGVDMEVELFLLDTAVYGAKKGQCQPEGLKELNINKKIESLMEVGVKVNACLTCIEGAGLTKEELIEGLNITNLNDLAKSIKTSKQVMVF